MIDSKTIGRYFSVYACIGVLFSFYSYCLDMIFYKIEYGTIPYIGSMGSYLLAYFVYIYITLPGAFFYNAIVNNVIPNKPFIRICFGIFVGAVLGYSTNAFSYYIGQNRRLKYIVVLILVGLSVEILRIIVVKRREQKKVILGSI